MAKGKGRLVTAPPVIPPAFVARPPAASADPVRSFFVKLYSGRINRASYFLGPFIFQLAVFLLAFLLGFTYGMATGDSSATIISTIANVTAWVTGFIYNTSFAVRRAHDIGKKWTYILWLLIPLVNIVFALILIFKRGDQQENEYGPPPRKGIFLGDLFGFD